jgi:hypothetical protein
LDRINISVEGVNAEQYGAFSGYDIDYRAFTDQIRFFYDHRNQCEMIVKINGDILSEEQKQEFYDVFGEMADGVFIESVMDCWPVFEQQKIAVNQQRGIYGEAIGEVLVCPYVFYSFAVNADGSYSLCFLDWQRKLGLGHVRDMTVKEVWESGRMREYQRLFLSGRRKTHPICADCGQLKQGQPDDIDAFAGYLLEKLERGIG